MCIASHVKLSYGIIHNFVRGMSSYSSYYLDPIISRRIQKETIIDGLKTYSGFLKPPSTCLSNSIFYDDLIAQFTCYMSQRGNKNNARLVLEKCFENIKRLQLERYHLSENRNTTLNVEKIFTQAIMNCRPVLILTQIKRGGVKYRVPMPSTNKKSYFLSMLWLLQTAKEKERNVPLSDKLAWDVVDAAHGKGRVMKKKLDLYKLCEENRAYAHYRWS